MNLGSKIINAFARQLRCPVCSDKEVNQNMMQYEGMSKWLFCPHCDLGILIDRPSIRGFMEPVEETEKGMAYVEQRVDEFIKE